MITYRRLDVSEKSRIAEIDRSEHVTQDYVQRDGRLVLVDVDWKIPRWSVEGDGSHSVAGKLKEWDAYFQKDCIFCGAFDGDVLVGFSVYRPRITEDMGQFAILHVSKAYRRQGIGRRLAADLIDHARREGDKRLYVSSAQTRKTVDFYRGLGFHPVDKPVPELYEMEPNDIHMVMNLTHRNI
jgi:GNAT superfamily N-acetyltransferase